MGTEMADGIQLDNNSHLPVRPGPVKLRPDREHPDNLAYDSSEPSFPLESDKSAGEGIALRRQPHRTSGEFRADFQAYLHSRADRLAPGTLSRIEEEHRSSDIELQDQPLQSRPASNRSTNSSWPLRRPARSIKTTLQKASRRVSITPSDVQFSVAHLEVQDTTKAEELLGLRSRKKEVPAYVLPWDYIDPPEANNLRRTPAPPVVPRRLESEPKNGRQAWMHALAAVLVVFNCWGFSNAFGLFQGYYERYHLPDVSPGTIAWIGSTQIALVFLLGVPVGVAVDAGYFKIAFYGGTIVMIVGLLTSSFCTSWSTLWLTQGLLTGLGSGSVFTAGLIALMSWFDESRMGLAMGLGAAGSCLGGITFVLIARNFIPSYGSAFTMRILGALVILTMIPPCMIFRMRQQTHRPRPRTSPRRIPSARSLLIFADAPYLSACAGMFCAFQGLYFGFVYIVDYAVQVLHLSNIAATNLLIFMLVANLPGRFVPALISDKCLGPLNTLIPSTLISSAIIWLWLASGDVQQGGLTVLACFYGFASAGIQSLYASATYSFCLEPRRTDSAITPREAQAAIDKIGLKAGGLFSCIGVACLVGTPISGALLHYRTDRGLDRPFLLAQAFAAGSLLLGACFLILSRVQKIGCEAKRA